jgi:glycosyltransferase involved in cell wall biosynthesis
MASGLAIVASAVGQLPEVLQDGRNALLVPPEDAGALAAALLRLIDDEDLRGRVSRQARADAEQRHSWDRYLTRLECLFGAVIDGRPVVDV